MLITPFDEVIEHIEEVGYHNHRREGHSDLVSEGMWHDLLQVCPELKEDVESGTVGCWINVRAPGGRKRYLDLFVGEPDKATGGPDFDRLRIGVEHKSVITAHRNKTNRYDDLQRTVGAIHKVRPEAVLAATVLVGTARRVLNVPDFVKKIHKHDFEDVVLPRLSTGDDTLWEDFKPGISQNRADDPAKTIELFRSIPVRNPSHTHIYGYDFIQLVPVFIDNVNPPRVERQNDLGIDVDADYQRMLGVLAMAYKARWHLK